MVVYDVPRKQTDETIVFHKDLDRTLKRMRDGAVLDDEDTVIFIDGSEGSGKSQTARQIGYMLARWSDTPFSLDNVHNNLQSYIDFSLQDDRPDGMVSILDEGKKILNKFRQMSGDNVEFTEFLSENRTFNMHHIICAPSYHGIGEYVAKWRMRFLIHHYKTYVDTDDPRYMSGRKLVRGNYELYDSDKELWKHYDYDGYTYPDQYDIKHTIKDVDPLKEEEQEDYEEQKERDIYEKYGDKSFQNPRTRAVGATVNYVRDERLMSKAYEANEENLDMSKRSFRRHLKKWEEEVYQ